MALAAGIGETRCSSRTTDTALAPPSTGTSSTSKLTHTTATLLRHAGVMPRDFADMLGHRDERMFDQHYSDHRVERVVDLTEAQGRMLGG